VLAPARYHPRPLVRPNAHPMARPPSQAQAEVARTSLRRRLLKYALVALGVLVFTGYFAFQTFVFDPLEDDVEGHVSTLVPRDVDFYLGKDQLGADFAVFPPTGGGEELVRALEGGERLLALPAVQSFLASSGFRAWESKNGIDKSLQELNTALAGLPIAVDVLEACGGESVCTAGYLRDRPLAAADWCVYARLDWKGKAAFAALAYPGVVGLDQGGLRVDGADGQYTLSGGGLSRTLFARRVRDVGLIGTNAKLVSRAAELEAAKGQDSLGQSARYADHVQRWMKNGHELAAHVDLQALLASLGMAGKAWPDASAQDWTTALVARLFQGAAVKEFQSVVDLEGGLGVRLHADLSSEKMTPAMKRLYRAKGFELKDMLEVAKLATSDAMLLFYAQTDIGDLLRQAFEAWEPAGQKNLNDQIKSLYGYPDTYRLIEEIDAALKSRVALVVRPMDYPDEGLEGPDHDTKPTVAWAVVGWMENPAKVNDLHRRVEQNPGMLGIAGRKPGDRGVYTNRVNGVEVYEFWNRLVPGTGHISTSRTQDGLLIVSNHHQLIGDIIRAYYDVAKDPRKRALKESSEFLALTNPALAMAACNAFLYAQPRTGAAALRKIAAYEADVAINWSVERPRIENAVAAQSFGGRIPPEDGSDERLRFDDAYRVAAEKFQAEFKQQNIGAKLAADTAWIGWAEIARSLLVQLDLDEKKIEISARAIVPFE
jgi:hypothetical protein